MDTAEGSPVSILLSDLARRLSAGSIPSDEVRSLLPVLETAGPRDVADAVDRLVAEGMDLEIMRKAVSRLLNLLHRSLNATTFEPQDPFFGLLVAENRAILRALDRTRAPLAAFLAAKSSPEISQLQDDLLAALAGLSGVELHYVHKENVLFPYFEARYPRYRCLSLMWALHDDVRAAIKELTRLLEAPDPDLASVNTRFGRLFFDLHALVFREENILFPIITELLSVDELQALFREAAALGPGLLETGVLEKLRTLAEGLPVPPVENTFQPSHNLSLGTGGLSLGLIDLILRSLPLDISFVDATDRLRYYSETPDRVFPRSPAVIGREVKNCHPAASVERVMRLIEAFRRGERDREAFWIDYKGRFIHIEYRAIRSPEGEYLGTLEVSQDLTEKRALTGEKRLASF